MSDTVTIEMTRAGIDVSIDVRRAVDVAIVHTLLNAGLIDRGEECVYSTTTASLTPEDAVRADFLMHWLSTEYVVDVPYATLLYMNSHLTWDWEQRETSLVRLPLLDGSTLSWTIDELVGLLSDVTGLEWTVDRSCSEPDILFEDVDDMYEDALASAVNGYYDEEVL